MKNYVLFAIVFLFGSVANSQVILTETAPNVTIDFSASMPASVGNGAYKAAGFSPNPTVAGRLNSNAWDVRGFDFGTLGFGGTQTVDDFGRGQIMSPVLTAGLYAYTELPGSLANPAFMMQPGENDFNPGSIVLRIRNNGTINMTQLAVSYNLFIRNDEGRASSFNFSHSSDDVVYEDEPGLDYISPETPDAFQWTAVGVSPARSMIITGINIAPGHYYYLRWRCEDVSGTGDRDEFGLDDITLSATYGAPAPEINVKGVSGVTILSGDTTPTVAEGTDFAPVGAPLSTIGASLNTTFQIQNLGGAVLNVSNIQITGAQASDFTIFIPSSSTQPTGNIQPASATGNYRELTIIFDPSDEGLRKARVTITNTDSNENPYWFDIQGYGLIPKPDINVKGFSGGTANINSGNMIAVAGNNTLWAVDQLVGSSTTKEFRIQNTANISSVLQLTGTPKVQIAGANPGDFTVTTQPTSTNINGGFGSNFVITFTPQASGIRTAVVSIANNDLISDPFTGNVESPYTFLIQGKGVAPEADITGNGELIASGSTTPSLLNHTFFDYLNITGITLNRVFTVRNTGTMPLNLGALTITGANASEFSIIALPSATLAVNATTTFTIRFDPSSAGIKNATVSLVNNDFDENPYTFAIRGYGLDYVPCAFGPVEIIAMQDFETAPATPVWTFTNSGGTLTGGTAYAVSGDGGTSAKSLGSRSFQALNTTGSVTFNALNTLLYSDLELSIRLASLSTTATEGSDATDKVTVAVSANGGLNWSNEFDLVGSTNAKWSFASGTGIGTTPYDGNNVLTNFITSGTGYLTTTGNSTLRLSNLPKTANLMLRVTLTNNNAAEIWALDDVTLFGRKEVSTTWNGSNWSNGTPAQNTKAVFNGNYNTASGNIAACKCVVNAGRTIIVNPGNFLNIESDLENSGTIIIENGGSLVQRNDFATNIGNVTVRRNSTPMRLYDYTYWSSPVSGQTLYNVSPATRYDKFFSFNTQLNSWQSLVSSSVMAPGVGYIIRSPQYFTQTPLSYPASFVGMANNGFVTPPVYNTSGTWNLVGNPYPSAINADAFLQHPGNAALLTGTLYFWTHNTSVNNLTYNYNDYAVYNLLGGIGTVAAQNIGLNNTVPNGKIASGQGFFVISQNPGTLTFNNSMRIPGNNMTFFRSSSPGTGTVPEEAATVEKHRIWLDLYNDNGRFKQTLVGYAAGASNDFEGIYDGPAADAGNELSFYSLIGQAEQGYSIQGRALPFSNADVVPMGYKTIVAGSYAIGLEGYDGLFDAQDIYLEDKLTGVIHDLKQGAYAFTTDVGTFNTRFELRFTTEQLGTPDALFQAGLTVAVKDRKISVRSAGADIESIAIYDLLGRNIYEKANMLSREILLENVSQSNQSVIIRTTLTSGAVISKKIIL